MTRLRQADLAVVLQVTQELADAEDLDELRTLVLAGLTTAIPCDHAGWAEWSLKSYGVACLVRTTRGDTHHALDRDFQAVAFEHPACPYWQSGGVEAVRISDFASRRDLGRLQLYHAFYKPAGIEFQLSGVVCEQGGARVFVDCDRRARDFSDRDRQVLEILRGSVARSYTQLGLRQAMRRALERVARGDGAVLIADDDGAIVSATAAARELLAEHVGNADVLPRPIFEQFPLARAGRAHVSIAFNSLRAEVFARLGELPVVSLAEEGDRALDLDALRRLGLTPREAEVLAWVARGKTNPQIARALWVSPRTVQKHLEHVFDKLGVRTRTEAAARALQQ